MFVITIHHKNADTEFREKLALQPEEIRRLQEELHSGGISEAVYLHTCNRCELYGVGDHEEALRRLARTAGVDLSELRGHAWILEKEKAAQHVFRVASGMDSMVLGEDEILGQLRDAYEKAKNAGYTGYQLNTVLQAAFSAAKRVKTDTMLSKSSVSVATLAASAAHKYMNGPKKVLLIGASGDTGRKTMLNLLSYGDCEIMATYRNRHGIPEGVSAVPYEKRYEMIREADVVISATSSPHYTLTKNDLEKQKVCARRRLFIDLAVPRDVDECIRELAETTLMTIDDFEAVAREHNEQKQKELAAAEEILREQMEELLKELLFHEQYPLIRRLQDQQTKEFMKFLYRFRKQADAEEFRSFLTVLARMYG